MGKLATRAGVQVTKAVYANEGTGHTIDLFAKSEPGQHLVISGTGIAQTEMRADGAGNYYGRVFADGNPPADLAVTNITDNPKIGRPRRSFTVRRQGAHHRCDLRQRHAEARRHRSVRRQLRSPHAVGLPDRRAEHQRHLARSFTVPTIAVPPADVTVTSTKGGTDSDDVVITGADFTAVQVVASISTDVDQRRCGPGRDPRRHGLDRHDQQLRLDPDQRPGRDVHSDRTVDQLHANRRRLVRLQADGHRCRCRQHVVSANISINVVGTATPVANAGPDQLNVAPTSTVTLNGTASSFAAAFAWTGPSASRWPRPIPPTRRSSCRRARTPQTLTFTLKVTGASGAISTDTVVVTTDPDDLSIDSAQFKRGGNEWRIRGTAQYCSANNLVTFTWNKPGCRTGGPRFADPGPRSGCVQLRLPVEGCSDHRTADGRRHHHGDLGDGRSGRQPDVPAPLSNTPGGTNRWTREARSLR